MSVKAVVCTLFEGHYHYGVAALVNSLYKQGFRGDIFVGYRGNIPQWAKFPQSDVVIEWKNSRTFNIAEGLHLHFLPLETDYHFTNYKPDFMLSLWNSVAIQADQMFYFDPDIVVVSPWSSFSEWAKCGIALCEDVNSPLEEYHPRRVSWRQYYQNKNIDLCFKNSIYVNGGFIGLENKDFLILWKKLQELMAPHIGGLRRSALAGTPLLEENNGPFAPFSKTDQDALNATIEAWDSKVSFIGKEAMSFKAGASILPHALGKLKPWKWSFIAQSLRGYPPRVVDRAYWRYANGVIKSQPSHLVFIKQKVIVLAAFIGRFYRRGGI